MRLEASYEGLDGVFGPQTSDFGPILGVSMG